MSGVLYFEKGRWFTKEVTKRSQGCDKPASSFLVVEDKEKVTTWHLPYKDCQGKPDRGLASSAWAALFSNNRGNPYQGPNKEQAKSKLRSVYRNQGWDIPESGK